ncbi:MAG: polysaccharide deacetylase family protein [Eubacteriales bacterium]|nr:polysaccharide deacetylase family protein [Christensenellaceae bacterium]MDD6939175.1 polysaccharide deacetylase family protein [Christensenellaceae bacterium]MDY2748605.1 polysaccharide deacetylase family protein [Eubacteriales bacterium]MDY3975645.1 polysaccharide deacetylase family protein [Eubacteriales bacterium]
MIRRFYPSNKTLMRMGAAVCLAAVAALAIGGHGTAEPAAAIVNENGPMIALTFDDGPYPKVTGHILDVLEKNGVCATFFVLGSRIEGHEDMLTRMDELGCEIGNHSFSHADLTRLSKADCQRELSDTDAEIRRVTGHEASVVRPPYGYYNKTVMSAAERPLILWTVDTNDWRGKAPGEIADYVIQQAKEGSVILMHDQQTQTADAMEMIIPTLIEEGFRFVTVSELIRLTGGQCKGVKLPE